MDYHNNSNSGILEDSMEIGMSEIPNSIYIKINPLWKFWLWFKKPVKIKMVKELNGEPCLQYVIYCGDGREIVNRRKSDPIFCSNCGGEFKKTGAVEKNCYSSIEYIEQYMCEECKGLIGVTIYQQYGTRVNDYMVMYENIH